MWGCRWSKQQQCCDVSAVFREKWNATSLKEYRQNNSSLCFECFNLSLSKPSVQKKKSQYRLGYENSSDVPKNVNMQRFLISQDVSWGLLQCMCAAGAGFLITLVYAEWWTRTGLQTISDVTITPLKSDFHWAHRKACTPQMSLQNHLLVSDSAHASFKTHSAGGRRRKPYLWPEGGLWICSESYPQ